MHRRLERFAHAAASQAPEGGRVLDFGCGSGAIARRLARDGFAVTGADISGQMLHRARDTAPASIEWVELSPTAPLRLPFEDERFDLVVASSVFEYVDSPEGALAEIARVLRPGTSLVLTVPDMRHPRRRVERLARLTAFAPGVRAVMQRTPLKSYFGYLRLSVNRYRLDDWQALLRGAGLRCETLPACEDPLAMLQAQRVP